MLWAAMSVAFLGFLHIGEITCNSLFSKYIHLTSDDIHFSPLHVPKSVSITIKAFKTDPFHSGVTIRLIGSCPQLYVQLPLCIGTSKLWLNKLKPALFSSIKVENIGLVKDSPRKLAPSCLMWASIAVCGYVHTVPDRFLLCCKSCSSTV